MFSNDDKKDDLEDCFEHLSRVCEPDEKMSEKLDHYLSSYKEKHSSMGRRDG
jgi:hypothetical protein